VAIGAALVGVGIQQAVQYMPIGSNPTVLAALEWIITGLLTLTFLWLRPQGLLPERRRRYLRRLKPMLAPKELPESVGT
jgi:ABC-type branched-subunit amino acid transport system permease subunit